MGNLMEQKRTLWIIAAVGIFLLVVLGAALILYSPSSRGRKTIAATAPVDRPVQTTGWTTAPAQETPADTPAQEPVPADTLPADADKAAPSEADSASPSGVTKVGDLTVISENTTVYGLERKYPETAQAESDGSTMIDLNTLKTAPAAETVTPQNETSAKAIETVKAARPAPIEEETSAPVKNVKKSSSPVRTASAAKTSSSGKTASAKKPAAKSAVTQYWVQAASFASKKSADDARAVLDDSRIAADVFTYKDSRGRLFYRVRIGPYMTQSEAEYWRTRIVQISEFSKTQSYITKTTSSI
jgi:cell division septation protein DedD